MPRTTRSLCILPSAWKGDGPTAAPAAAVGGERVVGGSAQLLRELLRTLCGLGDGWGSYSSLF